MHHAVVMVGNAPGARIDIQTWFEFAFLAEAAQFGVTIAAAQRPVATTGASVVFQYLNFVAGAAQLIRRSHARDASAENQNAGAFRGAAKVDRALVGRFGGKTQ